MKMESMAQFLIKDDIIISNRKKYKVLNASTNNDTTTILIKDKTINRIITANKSEFFNIISPIKID